MEENFFFDAVFYINLDKREDRRLSIERQAAEIGLVIERIPGVIVDDDDPALFHGIHLGDLKIQAKLGCTRAHINAVKEAHRRNLSNVLILEDDIVFRDGFIEKAQKVFEESKKVDWDLLYLSGEPNCEVTVVDSNLCYIASGLYGLTAYAVNQKFFDKYLRIDPILTESIDCCLLNMDENYRKVYLSREMLCHQIDDHYSDIEKRVRTSSDIHQAAWDKYVKNTTYQ